MPDDLYAALGLKKDADADTIKKAYRKLAGQLHPDKNPGNARVEARFKRVNHAYEVLHDAKKRKLYDEFGEEGLREGFDAEQVRAYRNWTSRGGHSPGGAAQTVDLEDLFRRGSSGGNVGDLFGDLLGRSRRGRSTVVKGGDIESEMTIGFALAVRGGEVEIQLQGAPTPLKVRVPPGASEGLTITSGAMATIYISIFRSGSAKPITARKSVSPRPTVPSLSRFPSIRRAATSCAFAVRGSREKDIPPVTYSSTS
jgi:curved DNA-binding protein CbpA